ncbi:aminoglycoside phosphotransferase [Trinickia dabaoshanensis]|uniref:Aminoglycoside phosphotransferase n=2 Tax=Trinickia dabaoshanensis TaxID=564714 RepID=A0A2N7W2Q9_9BURK|nr:aminoglycoside phosphotransferase [Trinickia dabaoshanensis]
MRPMQARRPRLTAAQLSSLERALLRPRAYAHRTGHIRRIETHISILYLAGPFVYKRCKHIDLGFVDFTRPEARYRACIDSLRLNRRLARPLYLDLVEVVGKGNQYRFAGTRGPHRGGSAVDYALKMRRFRQSDLLSVRAARGALRREEIEWSAQRIAAFHRRAAACPLACGLGSAALVRRQIDDVLTGLEREAPGALPATLAQVQRRLADELAEHFEQRRAAGFVRECHGDLHLENIVRRGNDIVLFDCIEFAPELRWIDVTADLAFLVMDLLAHGRGDLATRLVDRWLLATGDYAGMRALKCYVMYRALVRAFVSILKAPAQDGAARRIPPAAVRYLALAQRLSAAPSASLVLCHGFSGSGKSVVANELAPYMGAIVVSSDVERKRASEPLGASCREPMPATAYSSVALDANYHRLAELADALLGAGLPVVVDASFLKRAHRASFLELAKRHGAHVTIVDVHAPRSLLVERLRERAKSRDEPSDADEAVLHRQMKEAEPLDAREVSITVAIDAATPREAMRDATFWQPVLARTGAPGWLAGADIRAPGRAG